MITSRASAIVILALTFLGAKHAEADAYSTVKSASDFAIGGVGVAGTMTRGELAMREIRDSAQAEEQLRKLLREATPAGQMYALFALRQLDSTDYAALSAPYRQKLNDCAHYFGLHRSHPADLRSSSMDRPMGEEDQDMGEDPTVIRSS